MPTKGTAFDRPVCNKKFKQAVIVDARLKASTDAPRAGLETELYVLIAESTNLESARAADARAAVREAVNKLEQNENPLAGMKPPASCAACKGSHKPHYFLCLARREPSVGPEKLLRDKLMLRLRRAYAAQQYDAQTVHGGASQPPAHREPRCARLSIIAYCARALAST